MEVNGRKFYPGFSFSLRFLCFLLFIFWAKSGPIALRSSRNSATFQFLPGSIE